MYIYIQGEWQRMAASVAADIGVQSPGHARSREGSDGSRGFGRTMGKLASAHAG